MTQYQSSKTAIINADRRAAALRGQHAGKFLVCTTATDRDGNFAHEPLKARGYRFGGTGHMGILRDKWFLVVDSEEAAEVEIATICEEGI